MDIHDSYSLMICTISVPSISSTLKKLCIQSDFHSSRIQAIYNDKEEIKNNIFIANVEPLLEYTNHLTLGQNMKNIDAKVNRPLDKEIN